jgi:tetratricopeptide (TPR) repeat protein
MRRRTDLLGGVALSLALLSAGAAHAGRGEDVAARIRGVSEALDDWRLDDAVALSAQLDKELPDEPPVQAVLGEVRFHQGDYESAVKLLSRAAEAGAQPPLLDLAKSTQKETQGYVSSSSEHFTVRTPPGKDELLQPIALWALEKAYANITDALDYKPKHKIVVDVLQDPEGLAHASTLTTKEIETSGTIALCKYNRLLITSPKALARGYPWLDTLAHEFTHLVISEKSHNTVPIWLHEGLAKYNETRWRGEPGKALDPAMESLLANAFKKNKLITFEQMHPSMAKLPSQEDASLAFAEVATVIEFMEKEKPRSSNAVLDALRDGATMDQALEKGFGRDLSGLQTAWKAYLKKRAFHVVAGAQPQTLEFVKDARSGGDRTDKHDDEAALKELRDAHNAPGAKMVRVANLLRAKRRLKAASVEYEKAIALVGPSQQTPALHNRLAGLYLELGEIDGAKRVLKDVAEAFPEDPQTQVLLGRVALRASAWSEARDHYERAAWFAPFNPEIHVALFHVAEHTKDATLEAQEKHAVELLAGAAKSSALVPAHAEGKEPFGILEVRSEPWGRVLLDGVDTGTTTPLIDYRVKPGVHRVRVVDEVGGKEQGQAVTLVEGQTARVEIKLESLDDEQRKSLVDAEDALLKPKLEEPKRPPPKPVVDDKKSLAPWADGDDEVPLDLPR